MSDNLLERLFEIGLVGTLIIVLIVIFLTPEGNFQAALIFYGGLFGVIVGFCAVSIVKRLKRKQVSNKEEDIYSRQLSFFIRFKKEISVAGKLFVVGGFLWCFISLIALLL